VSTHCSDIALANGGAFRWCETSRCRWRWSRRSWPGTARPSTARSGATSITIPFAIA